MKIFPENFREQYNDSNVTFILANNYKEIMRLSRYLVFRNFNNKKKIGNKYILNRWILCC